MDPIRIAGILYQVKSLSPEEMQGLIGQADFNGQEIRINNTVTEQTKKIALVHELLHIIDHAWAAGLTEQQIVKMSHGLVQVINDNQDYKF